MSPKYAPSVSVTTPLLPTTTSATPLLRRNMSVLLLSPRSTINSPGLADIGLSLALKRFAQLSTSSLLQSAMETPPPSSSSSWK